MMTGAATDEPPSGFQPDPRRHSDIRPVIDYYWVTARSGAATPSSNASPTSRPGNRKLMLEIFYLAVVRIDSRLGWG